MKTPAKLTGYPLALARAGWLAVVLLSVGLLVAGIPLRLAELQTICTAPVEDCVPRARLTPELFQQLTDMGLSARFYAVEQVSLTLLGTAVWVLVGLVVFSLRSNDRMALLVALALVLMGTRNDLTETVALFNPLWRPLDFFLSFLAWLSFSLFITLFPNGRFVPSWSRWVMLIWICLVGFLSTNVLREAGYLWLVGVLWLGFWLFCLWVQVYRYRRVSDTLERQQTKWVVFGATVAISIVLLVLIPSVIQPDLNNQLPYRFAVDAAILSLTGIPLSIGVAVLRSRLFDIDILIRRTLIYGVLTGALAGVYFGSVVLLESLFRAFGQQSSAAIVVSTLAAAALFNPLRRRVQDLIDRRFYRRKYDADQILAAFAAVARDEVELERLSQALLNAVEATVQPEQVSLWLRFKIEEPGDGG